MKRWILYALSALFMFCVLPNAEGAFVIRKQAPAQTTTAGTPDDAQQAALYTSTAARANSGGATTMLPRGRGTGTACFKSFLFGCFSIFPVLGLLAVPFAYYFGIKNLRPKRKALGYAIAGIVLATIGLAFSIAILAI